MKPRAIYLMVFTLVFRLCGYSQNPQFSQSQIKYDLLGRQPLRQISIVPSTPQPFTFTSINTQNMGLSPRNPNVPNPITSLASSNSQIQQQNEEQLRIDERQRSSGLADYERELNEEKFYKEQLEWSRKTQYYRSSFGALLQLNPDNFSLTKAVFLVETAYFDGRLQFDKFLGGINFRAEVVRQILKKEGLSSKNNLALNYGIQKLYQQNNSYYNTKTKQTVIIKPFKYDFEDFRGEKEYFKMFTSKMMTTNSGQCHSMPLLYLMIAEQLGAKAWLSLAPQHSFVQFQDKYGNLLNFESTNGNLVSSNWMLRSGFINANALKAKTYMDTLSQRQLFAQCLSDLLLGYMHKFGYDNYADRIRNTIRSIDPGNMTAKIIDANIKTQIALQQINAVGRPKEEDLPKYSEAYKAYLDMIAAYEAIDKAGYQDMPKEAYQSWLKTIAQEQKKQEAKELKELMQRNIQLLRKPRSTVVDRTRG